MNISLISITLICELSIHLHETTNMAAIQTGTNPTSVFPTRLAYRAVFYDNSDKTYADILRKQFRELAEGVRMSFDAFTNNLMSEPQINRYCLIVAIDEYVAKYGSPNDYNWREFCDTAYNHRPYQGW